MAETTHEVEPGAKDSGVTDAVPSPNKQTTDLEGIAAHGVEVDERESAPEVKHVVVEDRGSQEQEPEQEVCNNAAAPHSHMQSAPKARLRLRRLGEDDIAESESGESIADHATRSESPDIITAGNASAAHEESKEEDVAIETQPVSRYQFVAGDSDEDEAFDRQLDIDLESLSASVARLRRIAEEMGREIEIQNRNLTRMFGKDDQQAAYKAASEETAG